MEINLTSFLVNSSLGFEMPYQIMLLLEERLNSSIEECDSTYKDWFVMINLCHSDEVGVVKWIGPDENKRKQELFFTIYVGNVSFVDNITTTNAFISATLECLPSIFKRLQITNSVISDLSESGDSLLKDIAENYDEYIEAYTNDLDFDELGLDELDFDGI